MKHFTIFVISLMVSFLSIHADNHNLGVFANQNTNCIQFIDPATHTVSDPLLKGELGSYAGGLLDIVITSDGNTAIVSNFGDRRVFFIDISGGFNATPTILGSVYTSIFAEDLAITPDDKYLLVTDGAFSNQVAVIDITTRTFKHIKNLGSKSAQAVAITPDGELALFVEYFGGEIHSYQIDRDGNLSFKETQNIIPFWPVNVSISPDGKTVIVITSFFAVAPIFSIDSNHDLVYKGTIPLPSKVAQSCVFSDDGTKAYICTSNTFAAAVDIPKSSINSGHILTPGSWAHILNITGPGIVSASGTSIKVNPDRGSGQFFGVDTLALDPSENYLYITNPTSPVGVSGVSVIDLTTNTQVDFLPGTGYPTGIAFTTMTSQEPVE